MRYALPDLEPFVEFKKREKHLWRSVTLCPKETFAHGCLSRFLNCKIGTKFRRASQMNYEQWQQALFFLHDLKATMQARLWSNFASNSLLFPLKSSENNRFFKLINSLKFA